MQDFIDELQYYGLTARIKRLSDNLYGEARKVYQYLGYDIEPNWHLVILLLKKHDSLSVTEIAKYLKLSHPAIIKITKKMKDLDYIISVPDKKDSRKTLLSLSKKCKEKLPLFENIWDKVQSIIQECIDDNFLKQILHFEEKLAEKSFSERFKTINENFTNFDNKIISTMKITNSKLEDKDEIFKLYDIASKYMKSKNQAAYPKFSESLIETEIIENHQWKLLIDNQIACIWATTFDDPLIWGEKNTDPSVYIHRIVTNPDFRGRNLVKNLVEWSKNFAKENHKKYVRLDTVGNNQSLINHYTKLGFDFLGLHKLEVTEGLPYHYKLGEVCLFNLKV